MQLICTNLTEGPANHIIYLPVRCSMSCSITSFIMITSFNIKELSLLLLLVVVVVVVEVVVVVVVVVFIIHFQ